MTTIDRAAGSAPAAGARPMTRTPAWIEIDLDALVHNAGVIRRAVTPGTRLGLMVKANGYGHGLELAARAAVAAGTDLLMVATLDEGLALRAMGFGEPIMVAYPIVPDAVGEAVEGDLQLSVAGLGSTRRLLEAWGRAAATASRELVLHLEVDSGMGRGGIAPDDLVEAVEALDEVARLRWASAWSHLANGASAASARDQADRYEAALARVEASGRRVPMRHLAATEGVFAGSAPAYDLVRLGLAFYGSLGVGVAAAPAVAAVAAELRGAMTVKVRPIRVEPVPAGTPVGYGSEWVAARPSVIATLPIGYADGWSRRSWPGASALLRGWRVPLVGRVSMDTVCADVTDAAAEGEVGLDEELVLLGRQAEATITADELAELRGTVTNEVFTSFGPRLPRVARGA